MVISYEASVSICPGPALSRRRHSLCRVPALSRSLCRARALCVEPDAVSGPALSTLCPSALCVGAGLCRAQCSPCQGPALSVSGPLCAGAGRSVRISPDALPKRAAHPVRAPAHSAHPAPSSTLTHPSSLRAPSSHQLRKPPLHPVLHIPSSDRVPPIQPGAFPFSRREPQILLLGEKCRTPSVNCFGNWNSN